MVPNHLDGVKWMTGPGEVHAGENLRIVRAPSSGRLKVMILSHQVTGTYTHYMNGRTQPCMGQCCKGCESALPTRWHGWIIVLNEGNEEKQILEITEGPGETLASYFAEHRTLRGLRIMMSRPSGKVNGRVHLLRGDQVANHAELQKCPDLQRVLMKIWGLDGDKGLGLVGAPDPTGGLPGQQFIGRTVG